MPKEAIITATNNYERDKYVRTQAIIDSAGKRQAEQLLFEHGRERLKQMQQLATQRDHEQAELSQQAQDDCKDTKQQLIDQVSSTA